MDKRPTCSKIESVHARPRKVERVGEMEELRYAAHAERSQIYSRFGSRICLQRIHLRVVATGQDVVGPYVYDSHCTLWFRVPCNKTPKTSHQSFGTDVKFYDPPEIGHLTHPILVERSNRKGSLDCVCTPCFYTPLFYNRMYYLIDRSFQSRHIWGKTSHSLLPSEVHGACIFRQSAIEKFTELSSDLTSTRRYDIHTLSSNIARRKQS